MAGVCWLNERDVETDFNLYVTSLSGWPGNLATAPREVPVSEGPESPGGIIDPRLIRIRPGRATLTGLIKGATVAAGMASLDALRGLLSEGEVRVRLVYAPDRYCLGTVDTHEGDPLKADILDGAFNVRLGFVVKDGIAFRLASDGYKLDTTKTDCPIGTAHSYPTITVHGDGASLTNPTIVVYNASGDQVQSMGFTIGLGANDYLFVDSRRSLVSKSSSGSLSDGLAYWTSGDFPVLRPADAWFENAAWPSMALGGTGSPRGLVTYRRAYR